MASHQTMRSELTHPTKINTKNPDYIEQPENEIIVALDSEVASFN